jgi:hypothetical protein
MKKVQKLALIFIPLFLLFFVALGQTQKEGSDEIVKEEIFEVSIGGIDTSLGVNCFDYYSFPSISFSFQPDKLTYKAGETVKFSGTLKNENNYPIVDGTVFAQVFRKNPQSQTEGNYLVDEFFAIENLNLGALSEKKFSFQWQIPEGIISGEYFVTLHFQVGKKFNLSGLSFLEGVYGGISYFNVEEGKVSEVFFEKSKVSINGEKISFRSFIPKIEEGKPVKIDFSLKNQSQENQEIEITKRLFSWDNLLRENLLKEEKDEIIISKQSAKTLTQTFEKLKSGVYVFEVTAKGKGSKSILKVRFEIEGENPPARLNFLGLNKFPLKPGDNSFVFACFHSISDSKNFEGKVIFRLKDKAGNVILQKDYEGQISPQIMAIKQDFLPDKNYNDLILEGAIYDKKGNVVDEISLSYNCAKFNLANEILFEKKGNRFSLLPLNICGNNIPAEMSIEVIDDRGKVVFFEPSFTGNQFEKEIKLLPEREYKIKVYADGREKTIPFSQKEPQSKVPLFLSLAILSFLLIYFYLRQKRQSLKSKIEKT